MPYHDLNLLYTTDTRTLNHTLSFAEELGYTTIALSTTITGKLPSTPPALDLTPVQNAHPNLTLLSRLTLPISDPSQNHRLSQFSPAFSLLAIRPLNDKALQLACTSLDCDLISLDLSARLPFILKFKTLSAALQRGVRFEIAYSQGLTGGSDAKRNLIAGATSLIRATRGRGIVISSEARTALGLRGPHDVMNLCQIWGLEQARGKEAVCEEASKLVRLAALRRHSYRGVVTIVDGGGRPVESDKTLASKPPAQVGQEVAVAAEEAAQNGVKRKASTTSLATSPQGPVVASGAASSTVEENAKPLSKRELKRRAKKARLEEGNIVSQQSQPEALPNADGTFPITHESLAGASSGAKQRKKTKA